MPSLKQIGITFAIASVAVVVVMKVSKKFGLAL